MTPEQRPLKEDPQKNRPLLRTVVRHIVKAITAVIGMALVFYLIWNWTAVPLLTFPSLTYLQTLGAILLMGSLLLIGGRTLGRCRKGRDPSVGRCRFNEGRTDTSRDT